LQADTIERVNLRNVTFSSYFRNTFGTVSFSVSSNVTDQVNYCGRWPARKRMSDENCEGSEDCELRSRWKRANYNFAV